MNATDGEAAAWAAANRQYLQDTSGANMSEASTTLEELVRKASRPSLASLVRAGQKEGLIPVKAEYDFDSNNSNSSIPF